MHHYFRFARSVQFSLALLVLCHSAAWGQRDTAPDVGVRFAPPSVVALTGAHIVISSERELESASLVIENGKITAVGASIPLPPGAEVIDLAGKYIYPALIDPLAEFAATERAYPSGYWNENILPQRSMHEVADLEASQLEAFRKAGIAIVLAAPSDGIIKGRSAVVLTDGSLAQAILRANAFQHLQLFPARRSRSYPNSPMGAVALIRQALSDADWYAKAKQAVESDPAVPAPEYNAALQELEALVRGKQQVIIDGNNELYALRADRIAREFALKLIVNGSGREYRQLAAIKATNRKFIIPVNFPDAPKVESRQDEASTTLQELMHWQLAPENPAKLDAAGVDFVLTADGLEKKSDYLAKIRTAIERGLNEKSALRAITQGPAEMLEIEHIAGTLEAGKLANLLVTSGPLFDKQTEIEETWVAGNRHDWEVKQTKDLRGQWALKIADGPLPTLTLELAGEAEKLSGKIGTPESFAKPEKKVESDSEQGTDQPEEASEVKSEKSGEEKVSEDKAKEEKPGEPDKPKNIEVKRLAFNGYQLSGTFETEEFLPDESVDAGAAILGLALLKAGDGLELIGTIRWPNGSSSTVTAMPVPAAESAADEQDAKKKDAKKDKDESKLPLAIDVNYPLGAYGRTEAPEQHEWLLLKGATIWTCGDAGILESADLLVHHGLIEAVGKDIAAPENATIIDATGMHISPGIIDCHSHMATDGGVNESGQAITAEVRVGDFIDPNDITIYRHLAGGVTTANILHGSANPIGGQNQVIKLRWGSVDEELKMQEAPAGIKFALGENVKQSSTPESTRYPRSRMGVEQIMRDRFEAALLYRKQWHDWSVNPQTANAGLPPRRDYELETIAEILEKKRWVHCHSYRQDEILAMLRTLEDYDVTIGSLQHILEGYKVADAMAKHGATGSSFSDWWAYKFEVYDAIPFNGALMHKAGVVVSFNSDDAELARHLNHEAAKAVKYGGVSPEEALKFVTLNPAKQLRIDPWVGSLEVGKHADFVVWNRSPLSTLSVCTETWVDGRKYFDRKEDLVHREADAKLHRALVQHIIGSGVKTRKSSPDDDPSFWWSRHDEFCHHGHDEHDFHEEHHELEEHHEE
jgi:imidazolonepropionase-like amidohydrolase